MSAVRGQDRDGTAYWNGANEEAPRREAEMLGRGMLLWVCVSYGQQVHWWAALYQLLRGERLGRQVCNARLLVPRVWCWRCRWRWHKVWHWTLTDLLLFRRRGSNT
jgi:hypothetical protein